MGLLKSIAVAVGVLLVCLAGAVFVYLGYLLTLVTTAITFLGIAVFTGYAYYVTDVKKEKPSK